MAETRDKYAGWVISTVAGNGEMGFSGDGGAADRAGLVEPNGLAFSPDGTQLYIADVSDNRVRVIDMQSATIGTFAGTGMAAHDGDGGPAVSAAVFGARAVVCQPDGGVYILTGTTPTSVETGSIFRTAAGSTASCRRAPSRSSARTLVRFRIRSSSRCSITRTIDMCGRRG